jgi:quercetin dioxygenase-like cupin family protein
MIRRLTSGSFFGDPQIAKGADLSRFGMTTRVYQAGYEVPSHQHERGHFCYVLAGSYCE